MKVVLADPISWTVSGRQTGHYRAVAENYAAMFKGRDFAIAGGPIYKNWCDKLLELPCNQSSDVGHMKNKIAALQNCRALFREAGEAAVVLQSAGFATELLGVLFFADKKTKVFLIQYQPLGSRSLFCRILYSLARRKIHGVVCPNDEVGRSFGVDYCVVPDYIYTGDSKLVSKAGNDPRYDFVSAGMQHPNKGTLAFAEKVASSPHTMLIAGHVANAELKQKFTVLSANHPNIHLDLRYLNEEEYASTVASGRYAVMNYTDSYATRSSGVVFDFVHRRVPVVGRACKALQLISDNRMGYLYRSLADIDLEKLMDDEVYDEYKRNIEAYLRNANSQVKALLQFVAEENR